MKVQMNSFALFGIFPHVNYILRRLFLNVVLAVIGIASVLMNANIHMGA